MCWICEAIVVCFCLVLFIFFFVFGLAFIVLFCSVVKTVDVCLNLYVLKNLNKIILKKSIVKEGHDRFVNVEVTQFSLNRRDVRVHNRLSTIPLLSQKGNGGYPAIIHKHYSRGNPLNHGTYALTKSWLRGYHR